MNFEGLISIWNSIALVVYFALLYLGLRSMHRRARLYWVTDHIDTSWWQIILHPRKHWERLPILLKRALALYVGLALFGGIILSIRVTGIMFDPQSFERFIFVVTTTLSLLVPLGYYTKADIFDLDNPRVK